MTLRSGSLGTQKINKRQLDIDVGRGALLKIKYIYQPFKAKGSEWELSIQGVSHREGAAADHLILSSPPPLTGPGWTSDPGVPNHSPASDLCLAFGPAEKYWLSPSDFSPRNPESEKHLLFLGGRSWGQRSSRFALKEVIVELDVGCSFLRD